MERLESKKSVREGGVVMGEDLYNNNNNNK